MKWKLWEREQFVWKISEQFYIFSPLRQAFLIIRTHKNLQKHETLTVIIKKLEDF